jgi:hypothetical protein
MNPSMYQTVPTRCLTTMNNFNVVARSYNISHLDTAIAHLEQVLNLEGANALFSKTYWRGRVLEALSTPGLAPAQQARLQCLLDRIAAP